MNPTNEQIAVWLDPQRQRAGWWMVTRIPFGNKPMQTKYTGPDFYAPGVCEVEVVPVVLASGCQYWRTHEFTQVSRAVTLHFNEITRNPHHPTAINLALAKIKEAT